MRSDGLRSRQAIVAAATDSFRTDGPDASLEEIARRAGVGSATLHRHFRGRPGLLAAVYRSEVEALIAAAEDAGKDGLWPCLDVVVRHCSADRALLATLEAGGGELPQGPWESLRGVVDRLVHEAAAGGTVRPDISADDLLRLVDAVARSTAGHPADAARLLSVVERGCTEAGSPEVESGRRP